MPVQKDFAEKDLFECESYKEFLLSRTGPPGSRGGVRRAMAAALRCQPTFISQVLNGSANFSAEQIFILADFFALSAEQKDFLLLLLQRDRAGTAELKAHYESNLEAIKSRRLNLTTRLGKPPGLNPDAESTYYSSWHYCAVHIAVTIPSLRQASPIARALGLKKARVTEVLEFLTGIGLVAKVGPEFRPDNRHVRLGRDSAHILKHHTNWRLRAIDSMDQEEPQELHYSGVYSLSRADVLRLKGKMLEFIGSLVSTVKESEEEELYAFAMDYFKLTKA